MAFIANEPQSEGNSRNFLFSNTINCKLLAQRGAKGEISQIASTSHVTKNRFD